MTQLKNYKKKKRNIFSRIIDMKMIIKEERYNARNDCWSKKQSLLRIDNVIDFDFILDKAKYWNEYDIRIKETHVYIIKISVTLGNVFLPKFLTPGFLRKSVTRYIGIFREPYMDKIDNDKLYVSVVVDLDIENIKSKHDIRYSGEAITKAIRGEIKSKIKHLTKAKGKHNNLKIMLLSKDDIENL